MHDAWNRPWTNAVLRHLSVGLSRPESGVIVLISQSDVTAQVPDSCQSNPIKAYINNQNKKTCGTKQQKAARCAHFDADAEFEVDIESY